DRARQHQDVYDTAEYADTSDSPGCLPQSARDRIGSGPEKICKGSGRRHPRTVLRDPHLVASPERAGRCDHPSLLPVEADEFPATLGRWCSRYDICDRMSRARARQMWNAKITGINVLPVAVSFRCLQT